MAAVVSVASEDSAMLRVHRGRMLHAWRLHHTDGILPVCRWNCLAQRFRASHLSSLGSDHECEMKASTSPKEAASVLLYRSRSSLAVEKSDSSSAPNGSPRKALRASPKAWWSHGKWQSEDQQPCGERR